QPEIVIWDFRLGVEPVERRFHAPVNDLRSVSFLPDAKLAVSASDDNLFFWNANGKLTGELRFPDSVSASRIVRLAPRTFALAQTNLIQTWQVSPSRVLHSIPLAVHSQSGRPEEVTFELHPSNRLLLVSDGLRLVPIDLASFAASPPVIL